MSKHRRQKKSFLQLMTIRRLMQIDVIIMDFAKVFNNSTPPETNLKIREILNIWVETFLKDRK